MDKPRASLHRVTLPDGAVTLRSERSQSTKPVVKGTGSEMPEEDEEEDSKALFEELLLEDEGEELVGELLLDEDELGEELLLLLENSSVT
jgi:hypothetical protein